MEKVKEMIVEGRYNSAEGIEATTYAKSGKMIVDIKSFGNYMVVPEDVLSYIVDNELSIVSVQYFKLMKGTGFQVICKKLI